MPNKKGQAKSLLVHYFAQAAQGTWDFNSDNTTEIEEIVDLVIDAAVEEFKQEVIKAYRAISVEGVQAEKKEAPSTESPPTTEEIQSAYRVMLQKLEYAPSGACPVCGGFQRHGLGCPLAALLYPSRAEAFARQMGQSIYKYLLWEVFNTYQMPKNSP
jgi:hypothetical protein